MSARLHGKDGVFLLSLCVRSRLVALYGGEFIFSFTIFAMMSLTIFLESIRNNTPVSFNDTIAVITEHYHYQPTEFSNGLAEQVLMSAAGTNEGSCKIFAFAQIHQLTEQQTLNLFGDYYRVDVLSHPDGSDHQNIRNFMRDGWAGIAFNGTPLTAK